MATHSSTLAWRIPGMGEPGRLQSIGLQSWTWLKQLSTQACTDIQNIKRKGSKHTSTKSHQITQEDSKRGRKEETKELQNSQKTTNRTATANPVCMCAQSLSRVWLFATPWAVDTRLLCPWDIPGKNIGVGYHCLLQEIFLTLGSNPCLLHLLERFFTSLPINNYF